ncbi:hypothetical protein HZA76_03565 [Candidatus Roizmanbacteria bacterium]|nr:hypothetical protein [Candidatus Roizmanbacteria bacterium]
MVDLYSESVELIWSEAVRNHGFENMFHIHKYKKKVESIYVKSGEVAQMFEEMYPEFEPLLRAAPEKLGQLFGHFETEKSARRLEPAYDIISNVVAQRVADKLRDNLMDSEPLKKMPKKRRKNAVIENAENIAMAMIFAGTGKLNEKGDDTLPDKAFNFHAVFGQSYLKAMAAKGLKPNSWAKSKVKIEPVGRK